MKFLVHFIALTLLTSACVQAQEISLFNGRDLTGWTVRTGSADFRVKDGCIVGKNTRQEKGTHTFLTTNAEFGDFILTFEYKADADVNSGVQFRSQFHNVETRGVTQVGKSFIRPPDRVYGYQFEIATKGSKRNSASIYDEGRRGVLLDDLGSNPAAQAAVRMEDWNQGRIECRGDTIKTFLNGVAAASITDGMTPKGVIALQVHASNKPGVEVRWRNIKLVPLTANTTTATPSVAALPIQTDPNQPRIEVLKDQGPNALEWALAPLDQPLPPDIRQNLTYLREDLLDEAKQKPKAGANAYTLGSELCDKLLTAVELRNQASVAAGYTAAQADAGVRVDGSGINARRNYMMSWPQYAREKDQRSEIMRQQLTGADLKKERPKVEWAQRARAMRKALDDLYRQFRESLRLSVSK